MHPNSKRLVLVLLGSVFMTGAAAPRRAMPALHVEGNRIVDDKGKQVVLRGVVLGDPCDPAVTPNWNRKYFEEAKEWGANVVRLAMHPGFYHACGTPAYLAKIDQGIGWAEELGLYVILDWHSLGDPVAGVYDDSWDSQWVTSPAETKAFWALVSERYRGRPAVAFYELINELVAWFPDQDPTSSTWADWKPVAEELIDGIRAWNPKAIVIVGSFNYDYDLQSILSNPIQRKNVVYTVHTYPNRTYGMGQASWSSSWDAAFGFLAETYPLFDTELGFDSACTELDCGFASGLRNWGGAMTDYLARKKIGWTAWLFHAPPGWATNLISDWNFTPTDEGAFVKCVLQGGRTCSDTISLNDVPDVYVPAAHLPRLRVIGNQIVAPNGKPVVLRGLGLADLDKLVADGHWNQEYFQKAAAWGAKVVRIPVIPQQFRERGPAGFFRLLDQGVAWAEQNGLYVILDWHATGDPIAEVYSPRSESAAQTTRREIETFWKITARHYRRDPAIAFYELFNHPVNQVDSIDPGAPAMTSTTWSDWRPFVESLIDLVRAENRDAIPMVTGFYWGTNLSSVGADPIQRPGVVYVTHPFPWNQMDWQAAWGYVADTYPLFAAEIGFDTTANQADTWAQAPVEYGGALTDFLAARGSGWTALTFDPTVLPALLSDWEFTPTPGQGVFFQCVLQGRTGCMAQPPAPDPVSSATR